MIRLELRSNTQVAIGWFKHVEKDKYKFLQVDTNDYYSSINPIALKKALLFAKKKKAKMSMK